MKKGYVQVYTGEGKNTASLGLSIRAAGAGLKVYIVQFLKEKDDAEIKALGRFNELITIEQYGMGKLVEGRPSPGDIEAGKKGYACIQEVLEKGEHDLVVAEGANEAVMCNIFSEQALLDLMDMKPEHVELVVTGRKRHPSSDRAG